MDNCFLIKYAYSTIMVGLICLFILSKGTHYQLKQAVLERMSLPSANVTFSILCLLTRAHLYSHECVPITWPIILQFGSHHATSLSPIMCCLSAFMASSGKEEDKFMYSSRLSSYWAVMSWVWKGIQRFISPVYIYTCSKI